MSTQTFDPIPNSIPVKIWKWVNHSQWLVPICFLIFVLLFVPFGKIFVYNFDEGFELMRAIMQNHGFALYKDIWSDQPPFFSFLLRGWLLVFGNSIFAPRLLVLIFATILLYFYYKTLRLFFDHWSSIFGCLLLVFTRDFIASAVVVKIDMPAIALAVISNYFILYSLFSNTRWGLICAAISGICLILAWQTKLYTLVIMPTVIAYALIQLLSHWKIPEQRRSLLLKMGIWLLSLIILGGLSILHYRDVVINQILTSHLEAKNLFDDLNLANLLSEAFGIDYSFWCLAGIGLIFLGTRERWRIYFPCVWLVIVLLMFARHTPIWTQYYLWFAIPLSWLATMVFFWVKRSLHYSPQGVIRPLQSWRANPTVAFRLGLIVLSLVLIIHVLLNIKPYLLGQHVLQNDKSIREKNSVLENVLTYRDQTNWLVTDYPIFAFYANLKVPPEIVVISRKRVVTEGFDGEDFLKIIQKYHPEQVIIGRFVTGYFEKPFLDDPLLAQYLQENYVELTIKKLRESKIHHFVLRSLKANS
jgi:hypothetical protein